MGTVDINAAMHPFAFILLAVATLTALPLGRAHRPIANALSIAVASAILAELSLPPDVLRLIAVLPPAALAGAAWGSLQGLQAWPALSLALGLIGLSVVGGLPLTRAQLGDTYAALWLLALLVGAAACYRTRVKRPTRLVAIALLAGLAPEAVAWMAWGHAIDGGYVLANVISCISLAVVVSLQLTEVRRRWTGSPHTSSPPRSQGSSASSA